MAHADSHPQQPFGLAGGDCVAGAARSTTADGNGEDLVSQQMVGPGRGTHGHGRHGTEISENSLVWFDLAY